MEWNTAVTFYLLLHQYEVDICCTHHHGINYLDGCVRVNFNSSVFFSILSQTFHMLLVSFDAIMKLSSSHLFRYNEPNIGCCAKNVKLQLIVKVEGRANFKTEYSIRISFWRWWIRVFALWKIGSY